MADEVRSGGYDLEFLETLPDEFECSVCLLVLRDPQIVDCCGVKYCLSCIERISLANKPCPLCTAGSFKYMAEKMMTRKILDLKVKCRESKHGCQWQGKLRQLSVHQNGECIHTKVKCPLGCGNTYPRKDLELHKLDECPSRSSEVKFLSLTRKLESRLQQVEMVCSKQEQEIASLKEELKQVKEDKQGQDRTIEMLQGSLEKAVESHRMMEGDMIRVFETELMRRCFAFYLRITPQDPHWVSPVFHSNSDKKIALQLTAKLTKVIRLDSLTSLISQIIDRSTCTLTLNVLTAVDEDTYARVDLVILTNLDKDFNSKLYSLVHHKGLSSVQLLESDLEQPQYRPDADIGCAQYCFACQILVLNVQCSTEPPLPDIDVRI